MRHAARCLFLAALGLSMAGLIAGCTSFREHALWNAKKAFSNPDYVDTTEMEDETWITEAAETGRKGRTVEESIDPLNLREIFMSEKARSIERNVGIQ